MADPYLGTPIQAGKTNVTKYAIYEKTSTTSQYIYEVEATAGKYKAIGGRNVFISTELEKPFPMHQSVFVEMDYKIKTMVANGEAPEHVSQIFIGLIFHVYANPEIEEETDEVIFIQLSFGNSHKVDYYAAGNPDVKTGIYGIAIPEGLQEQAQSEDEFSHTKFDVAKILQDAIKITYKWQENISGVMEDKSKIYAFQNLSRWTLTSIYMGVETQGDATGNLQLTNFQISWTDESYYRNLWIYYTLLVIGGAGFIGIGTITLKNKRINKNKN